MEAGTQNIFILGLAVLFGWMVVILICASPQLFRDYIVGRCGIGSNRNNKIKMAEAKMHLATLALAHKPSAFLVGQAAALSNIHEATLPSLEEATLFEEETFLEERPGPSNV